ncbi:DUF4238 domain-containing protein [Mesorhizobium tamadayense]|uniref:DUF4238 domain-containing protein n=1 Tax=Mesorhizobium tamadayense TaxID=425306 RepID=A0A3P3EPZ2_9HYPH|nr:DUF4238 domain-containing protein [Mesorhizobium tamadayense]RRH87458.1 DUF4238 domain-containing protein [Mesorhizobium tamadayense]
MAENKNQHFVPRVHLTPFSVCADGKAIHLFNLDRNKAIFDAPVKNQCSRDYFYGQDAVLEDAIQAVEGYYGRCVADLRKSGAVINESHATVLRRFAYLQHVRTEAAARRSAELVFAATTASGPGFEQPTFNEAVKAAVIAAMRHYANTMTVVDDLKVRVVRNLTSVPFLTSDDPAVLANRWYQQRAQDRSYGISSAGALLFLPLTPTLLAIFLDGDVYQAEHAGGWINVSSPVDIHACNHHQVLNCAANLYFGDRSSGSDVQAMAAAVAQLRPPNRFNVVVAVPNGGTETHTRYALVEEKDLSEHDEVLVHVKAVRPVPPQWPSFLKFRHKPVIFTNDTGAGFRRRTTATSRLWSSPPWRKVRG